MNRRIISTFRQSRLMRCGTVIAIAAQVLAATPALAHGAAQAAVKATGRLAADTERQLAKTKVRVNRTVPKVTPPMLEPAFGVDVTTEMITRARIFEEPLIPVGVPSVDDNRSLGQLLQTVASLPRDQQAMRIDHYLQDRPASPWRPSLLTNAATLYAREGYYSRAAAYWQQAWELTRDAAEPSPREIADYTVGAWLAQLTTFGQLDKLATVLSAVESRNVRGTAAAKVSVARETLMVLSANHELAMFSGPEALKAYLGAVPTRTPEESRNTIVRYHPPVSGTTLNDLRNLSRRAAMDLEMVHLGPIGAIPVPSIVHLRSQHYSAIVGEKDGRYVVRDPALGGELLLTGAAIRDESTGYFLVSPQQRTEHGARLIPEGEATNVLGFCWLGAPAPYDPPEPSCGDPGPGGDGPPPGRDPPPTSCKGMPSYRFHPQKVSLILDDVPVGYTPPVGPPINFHLSYDHREQRQPQTIDYGSVGPMWSHNWLSFVAESPLAVMVRGQGMEFYTGMSFQVMSGATLVQVTNDPPRYERRLRDGTVEVFEFGDRPASQPGRRIFLTEVIDPQGHSVELTYDSSLRLVSITDAIGQVTTLDYLDSAHPLRITKVTDPFARFATMTYDALGRLATVTDTVNMSSSFLYAGGDFIQAMTTPYGTTTFRQEPPFNSARRIEATDPAGGTERVEYHLTHPELSSTVASSEVPTGFSAHNVLMNKYVVVYWDKLAMAAGPTVSNATITNLLIGGTAMGSHVYARNIPQSVKRPLESRVWYAYPNMTAATHESGTTRLPITIARVLEGGASQVTELTYNAQGEVTSVTDPLGRETTYSYATNGLDLLEARQVVSGGTDLLGSFANYTLHLPETITDGAGNDATITYNSFGQPLTVTNAKSETTTFVYETTTQNLLTVTGPVSGATTTFIYDGYNRVESVEGPDGYEVIFAYDALDRLTSRTYPDDTTETFTYSRLDLVEVKDRLGRITRYFYDRYGRRVATRDPAGRTVSLDWCSCGQLEALIDAKGQRTTWERDVEGRTTREIRADGTTDTLYTYDLTGRLKTITDPMDQVTTYSYNTDDSLAGTGFTNETIATPDISHTYDTYYLRPATMVDGNGTSTYTYKAAGTNGAGKLASVDGPFSSDTISYAYDELGRVLTRMLNSTGTEITYDSLGRLSQLEFPIGAFDYTYVGQTGRVATVTYPNSQTSTYSYFTDQQDFQLQTIHHKNPSAATLSKFDYTYDDVGNILTWRQERAGSAAKIYAFTNDLVDQLTSAVLTDTNSTPTILKRQAWAYDVAGNRTVDQTDDAVFASTHNSLNRVGSRAPGGAIVFAGSLNEGGTVTIAGQPATVDASNNFRGTAVLSGATTTVTVKAKDASGNETTKQYEVDAAGSTTSYTYDANGNLTSDGTKTYYWNALNQLVEVKEGTTSLAMFKYDGAGRRTEKSADGLTRTYIYDAEDIVEERISGSSSDTICYYHGAGIDEPLARKNSSDVVTYYLADHLGSVVQETNSSGGVSLEREYGPWGDLLIGGAASGYAFQGREWDSEISLFYFRARYYNATAGVWTADDPIGFSGGPNFSQFVNNNPVRLVDPFGLCGEEQQGRYKSPREAGKEAVQNINRTSIKEDREYAGMIYRNRDGSYDYTEPRPGERSKSRFNLGELTSDQKLAGLYHTHGDDTMFVDDWKFSDRDKSVADRYKVPSYLGTPWEAVLEYDPVTKKVQTLERGR